MNILILCRTQDLGWGHWAYARAFERLGVRLICVDKEVPMNVGIGTLLQDCGIRPSLILHPELHIPLLPQGLEEVEVPTACFQIDTYAYTQRRIQWSMLFDLPVVFHPGFAEAFRAAGHPGAMTLYHAAPLDLFDKPEEERIFDASSVGRVFAGFHRTRKQVLTALSQQFRMNDWGRFCGYEEMAGIYRKSKIVVNVPRDDFPQDANMRAFEAMAAGALLITRMPGELAAIGFEPGLHFIGYRSESEIAGLVRRFLDDEAARLRIARAGREKVLREHTYDQRAKSLIQAVREVEQSGNALRAPARTWTKGKACLTYLDYYAAHRRFDCAQAELRKMGARNLRRTIAGASLLGRAWTRDLYRKAASVLSSGPN